MRRRVMGFWFWSLVFRRWSLAVSGPLASAISWRNYPAVLAGSGQTVEHAVRRGRNLRNGLFAIAFVPQVGRHHTDHVGTVFNEHYARIVAHALEFTRLVGNLQPLRQVTRNRAFLVSAEHLEEI